MTLCSRFPLYLKTPTAQMPQGSLLYRLNENIAKIGPLSAESAQEQSPGRKPWVGYSLSPLLTTALKGRQKGSRSSAHPIPRPLPQVPMDREGGGQGGEERYFEADFHEFALTLKR